MDKVQGSTRNASRFIKINVMINNIERVNAICRKVPKQICADFERKYGQILDLLFISVKEPVLSALAQFWNSDLRCFELPQLDLVPTIEEYQEMLRIPIKQKAGVYLYNGSHVSQKKIVDLIGLPASKTGFEIRGSVKGWKKTLLEDHLETQAREKKWNFFKTTLALLIYGLVLFPFTMGLIDQAAMDVFFFYETQGLNPVMAILADTLMSMEECHKKDGGQLRCCNHLLYVWIITHLYASDRLGYSPDPFQKFHRIDVKEKSAKQWRDDFARYEAKFFPWVCPWYHHIDTIFSCGDFPNVPLMGTRGCIAYTPVIALRQLKWTQVVPRKEVLGGICFNMAWRMINKNESEELGTTSIKREKGSLEGHM
ncbi:hypothetical protein SESBI_19958 [Sesbania bispinosa]|nr:hypothetical protein SESBI_19958 [Sesbania bispinosa]